MCVYHYKDFIKNIKGSVVNIVRCGKDFSELFKDVDKDIVYKSFIGGTKGDIIKYYNDIVLKSNGETFIITVDYKHTQLDKCLISDRDNRHKVEYNVYIEDNLNIEEYKNISVGLEENIIVSEGFKFLNNEFISKISEDIKELDKYDSIINDLTYFKGIRGFNQRNPYHTDDLLEHSKKVIKGLYKSGKFSKNESVSLGYFHDVGKLYTQRFKDDSKTHATYLGHENVSGYIALKYNLDIKAIKIIYNHMLMMNYYNSNKVKKRIDSSEYFKELIVFNDCDKDK